MKECCLNCKYFWNKCCHNSDAFSPNETSILSKYQSLSEDGISTEMMEETNFGKFEDFEYALQETNLSKKKIKELLEILYTNVDDNKHEFIESIDTELYRMTELEDTEEVKVFIKEPDEFKCNKYW